MPRRTYDKRAGRPRPTMPGIDAERIYAELARYVAELNRNSR